MAGNDGEDVAFPELNGGNHEDVIGDMGEDGGFDEPDEIPPPTDADDPEVISSPVFLEQAEGEPDLDPGPPPGPIPQPEVEVEGLPTLTILDDASQKVIDQQTVEENLQQLRGLLAKAKVLYELSRRGVLTKEMTGGVGVHPGEILKDIDRYSEAIALLVDWGRGLVGGEIPEIPVGRVEVVGKLK